MSGPLVERATALLLANPALAERVLLLAEPADPTGTIVRTARDAAAVLRPHVDGLPHEVLVALALDKRHRVMAWRVLTSGCADATVVDPKQILRWALTCAARPASRLMVAHNHPSGDPEPSGDDLHATRRLRAACDAVGITLLDHVILAGDSFTSLAERGAL